MGNRKERRRSAKAAGANRRVKLDLLSEPSGDFGDLYRQEELGVGGNGKNQALSPSSPSSSDQRPENPLLLLGQYSDEEVEEELSREVNHEVRENTPTVLDEQIKVNNHDKTEANEDQNLFTEKVDQENKEPVPKLEKTSVIEDDKPEPLHKDVDTLDQVCVLLTSDMQTTGDVDSGWKMVLHEESNSYYYWNVVTGETSWETPNVLTQGNESAYDPKSMSEIEETHAASVDTQANNESTNDVVLEAKEHNENYTEIMANNKDEGFVTQSCDALSNAEAYHNDTVIQDIGGHGDESSDSFRHLQLCENLLERLKSLEGYKLIRCYCCTLLFCLFCLLLQYNMCILLMLFCLSLMINFRSEGFSDKIQNLKFELDIRLADIKSLVPYGSSLLPFWLHSENQLKILESSINSEVLKHSQLTNTGEIKEPKDRFQENNGEHENAIPTDINPNVGHHSVEDDDMDVEMEVEYIATAIHSKDEVSGQNMAHLDSREPEQQSGVPPPPNDDWIPPPPPPDEEPLPPPPPDEAPETPFPPQPSDIQTTQPYSYGEQYSYTYPGSGYDYYGQTNTEIPNNSYYVDTNGSHMVAPLPTVYYAPVVNPEPVTYYTLPDGAIPTAPVISSGLQNSVYENLVSDQTKSSTVVPAVSASSHLSESSSVKRDVSVVSAPSVAPTEPATKAHPKVTRIKKRTVATVPTLRANKKVSGLVDKWMAVKEELHEDEEDEPENALEVLEKKRQREIEQWHAQQIASGEAKGNANFQPLGGDWRERVRRKRVKKSTQAEEIIANAIEESKQQPDLAELSKRLPTGWQAYWDESSKQVYYGNSKTSETTWTKPTKVKNVKQHF
ncbi:uncharacterized protein LOC143533973 isoform X2 [Bidens hawaiensis]|uniref:uncharacterized protein LOC143533973 isoform X2 n=1 Tax=Bidens hawaiensis TaxID=980011 RepID=UPI00404B54FB